MSFRRGGGGFHGGGGFGRRSSAPKPVEVGKIYDLEVTDTSKRGEGVAKFEGLVVFIPGAKPGQKLKAKITRVGARFAVAEPVGAGAEEETEETETEEIE
nr:TRAM domain-containing protein [Candidatus Njordarchaeum guaymaensis]